MRILIVDDCEDSAFLMAELLKASGCEAQWTHDSRLGLEIAASWQPHAVFVDIALPGENGYALAQRLRTESGLQNALIVAISGYADDKERRLTAGIDAHLLKPVSLQSLREVIARKEDHSAACS